MNLRYLRLPEVLELLTFFVISPALSIVVAYRAWRENKSDLNPKRSATQCLSYGAPALLLLWFAMWINGRIPHHFLQLTCTLLGLLLFGVSTGYFFCVLLGMWRWHSATRFK
jgi:ABC-type polysaccharide/polyol phosphate export permease